MCLLIIYLEWLKIYMYLCHNLFYGQFEYAKADDLDVIISYFLLWFIRLQNITNLRVKPVTLSDSGPPWMPRKDGPGNSQNSFPASKSLFRIQTKCVYF